MKRTMGNRIAAVMMGFTAMSLAACGNSASNTTTAANGTKAAETTVNEADGTNNQEYTNIVYAFKSFNNIPEDVSDVEEAINQITREKIGVEVTLMPIASSSYGQQVSLAMQGGEQIDLFHTGSGMVFANALANHQMMDITDLIYEYAPEAAEAVGEDFLRATSQEGRIYGIPADKGVALAPTFLYRADIMEEIGINPDDIKELEDLTQVFAKVKENYPDMTPLVPVNPGDSGMINTIYGFDYLGDKYLNPTGILRSDDNSMTIENFYETEEFKNIITLAREWYQAGYIMGDAATTTSLGTELLSVDKGFAYISNYGGNDAAAQISAQTGKDIGGLRLDEPYLNTSVVNNVSWAVASTSKNPEKALQFLNLTYTDRDVINLIIYGLEGRDYIKIDENTVAYPEGLDASSVPYTAQLSCGICGSQFNQYVMEGASIETLEIMKEDNQNSGKSAALGFMFDSTPVKTQYTSVTNVINQYLPGLRCGSLDPETELPKFQQQLIEAGLDEIIAEEQKQLDAWLASN